MVVLARELSGRGHDVVLGVSLNLVAWCHRAGVPAQACGPQPELRRGAQGARTGPQVR